MTVPIVRPTLALLAALVLAAACGDAGALDSGAQEDLEAARAAARQAQSDADAALRSIDGLEEQLTQLDDDLAATRAGRKKLGARLRKLGGRLSESIENLRTAVDDLQAGAASAEANADEALARAAQVARDLAVLEQRYNYHLRRYHGGG